MLAFAWSLSQASSGRIHPRCAARLQFPCAHSIIHIDAPQRECQNSGDRVLYSADCGILRCRCAIQRGACCVPMSVAPSSKCRGIVRSPDADTDRLGNQGRIELWCNCRTFHLRLPAGVNCRDIGGSVGLMVHVTRVRHVRYLRNLDGYYLGRGTQPVVFQVTGTIEHHSLTYI